MSEGCETDDVFPDPLLIELEAMRPRRLSARSYDRVAEQLREREKWRAFLLRRGLAAVLTIAAALLVAGSRWRHLGPFARHTGVEPLVPPLTTPSAPRAPAGEAQFTLGAYTRACGGSADALIAILDRQAARPAATPAASKATIHGNDLR